MKNTIYTCDLCGNTIMDAKGERDSPAVTYRSERVPDAAGRMTDEYAVQTVLEHEHPRYMAFSDSVGTYGEGDTVEDAIADFWREVAYDIKDFQRKPTETLSADEADELSALLELRRRNGKED